MTPAHRATRPKRRTIWVVGAIVALVLLTSVFDWRLFHLLAVDDPQRLTGRDWYQFLRAVGYLPTWAAIALAIALCDAGQRRGMGRGLLVIASALVAGAIAELGKLVISRERPISGGVVQNEGAYTWKGLFQGFVDGGNLGMPSSHAAVAFGGAAMVGVLFPPARLLMLTLAAGCGLGRLLSGAHFASDVVVGACAGVLVAWALGHVFGVRPARAGLARRP